MWTWVVVAVLILAGPRVLRWWVVARARRNLLSLPLYRSAYTEVPPASVPSTIREGLAAAAAELTALGFEPLGIIASPIYPGSLPRFLAVLRHPGAQAIATVGFALGELKGATVEFETALGGGLLVWTINRRGQAQIVRLPNRRLEDPLVGTIADQWRAHLEAVATEPAPPEAAPDLAGVVRRRNELDVADTEEGVRAGLYRVTDDGRSFRFTPLGVDVLLRRLQEAAARLAKAPRPTGALAMPIPVDDQERKYQDLRYILAQRPRRRGLLPFLVSLGAFAASAFAFPHWAWLLWAIPFLLFHELGHFVAMRVFGHREATIRFVPFFGAATLTTTQFRTLSQEMVVLLAGPLPGLALGFTLFQLAEWGRDLRLISVGITLVTINGLNLLPLFPFDGGRVLHALVTAGRPRLDLALKLLAGAAFVAGALYFRDPTLVLLVAASALLVRPGLRRARIENAVRARPGFGPQLSPAERRRLIFLALDGQPASDGETWVRNVQELEVALGHGRAPLGSSVAWVLVYAGCLGALCAWTVNVFSFRPKLAGHCPTRAQASPYACGPGGSARIDWKHPDPDSVTRNPFKLISSSSYPYAAFVWCTAGVEVTADVSRRMREVRAAEDLCPAFPWEALPAEARPQRERARWTLQLLTAGGALRGRAQAKARLRAFPPILFRNKSFDPDTLRLYQRWIEGDGAGEAQRQLSERIGRSPTASCDRLQVLSVGEGDGRDDGEVESREDEGAGADSPAEPAKRPRATLRLGVRAAAPSDLAPLAGYLCEAGCAVDALPYGTFDPRLRACF